MITLTSNAIKELKSIMKDQEKDFSKVFVRVGCKGGGCSGMSYVFDINDEKKESDEVFVNEDLTVICDPKSYLYLNGLTVDFKNEIMGRGFTFLNITATGSCGCGNSFSA